MAKAPISELFSTLKSYTQKLSDGERTPAEIASALNDWAHESAESVRGKIHDEVESAVLKMGFVKREEFDALAKEVAALKKNSPTKKAAVKKSPVQKSAKKIVKKSVKKKVAK
jgi:BMFP domain-containing protein YqiC